MSSTKLPAIQVTVAKLIQLAREAPGIPTFWLPTSYVMAHVEIESGFNATVRASDYSQTGSLGLMQVERATATDVSKAWPNAQGCSYYNGVLNQLDPYSAIVTGMLYLHTCKEYLLPIFGSPLLYKHVCMAYNEGPGNAGNGVADLGYYLKWLSAQQRFAFLDHPDPNV